MSCLSDCTLNKIQSYLTKLNLTTREREITVLWIKDCNYKEIALIIGISESTVRKHIFNVYTKLGVHSKIGLLSLLLNEIL
ncbi:helix-turn-helix transcriptional regulator [Paenibacillus sp. MZ04-78.2]|uniref:helix-turn-helix transcriptional regulator n=1 Tax=Paenibacillus sp. MZ04-78.2 TaxID=2962034 RepID=UPI0020B8087C|nr:helix-turn-helix transcriptional regulator [Paenibacillus sp. MZ04-78.2]MCP3776468.1 helix-turn-helix transcriptional regulator [Paenibacillus sp. MZ04-78.2]